MKCLFNYFIFLFACTLLLLKNAQTQNPQWQWVVQAGGNTQELSNAIACDNLGNSYITGYFTLNATFETVTISSYGSEDIFIAKYNNNGGIEWAKHAGSTTGSNFGEQGRSIAVDSTGNVYITGSFLSNAYFDTDTLHTNGTWDMFVAKYNNDGNIVWTRHGGGTNHDHGNAIALDSDGNVYVAGTFKYDAYFGNDTLHSDWGGQEVFFAKYDTNGNLIWVKKFAGPFSPHSTALCVDKQNNVYVTGGYTNSINFDATYALQYQGGNNRIYIVKFNDAGQFEWATHFGGILDDYSTSIDTDENGDVFVTGHFFLTAYFDDDSLTVMNPGNNNADIFLAKYSTGGSYQWAKQIDPTLGTARSIVTDEQGNAYICGLFNDSLIVEDQIFYSDGDGDIFVAGYDSDGNYLWYNQAGGTSNGDEAKGIGYDGNGNLYVTGSIRSIVRFTPADTIDTGGGDKIFLARLGDEPYSIDQNDIQANDFRLIQNYPNPFNPKTTIEFSIPKTEYVTLKIYSIIGQDVATLVSKRLRTGKYKYVWDAGRFASGIYISRFETGNGFVQSRKLILLR